MIADPDTLGMLALIAFFVLVFALDWAMHGHPLHTAEETADAQPVVIDAVERGWV